MARDYFDESKKKKEEEKKKQQQQKQQKQQTDTSPKELGKKQKDSTVYKQAQKTKTDSTKTSQSSSVSERAKKSTFLGGGESVRRTETARSTRTQTTPKRQNTEKTTALQERKTYGTTDNEYFRKTREQRNERLQKRLDQYSAWEKNHIPERMSAEKRAKYDESNREIGNRVSQRLQNRYGKQTLSQGEKNIIDYTEGVLKRKALGYAKTASDALRSQEGYKAQGRWAQEDPEFAREITSHQFAQRADKAFNDYAAKQEQVQKKLTSIENDTSGAGRIALQAYGSGLEMGVDRLAGPFWAASMFASAYGNKRGQALKEGATDEEDARAAWFSAGTEVATEYMFKPVAGIASKFGGKHSMDFAGKLAAKITSKLTGNKAKIADIAVRTLGSQVEEGLEEVAGWLVDPALQNYAYKNDLQKRREAEAHAEYNDLQQSFWNQFESEEEAQQAALHVGSKEFVDDLIKTYTENGATAEEARSMAETMQKYFLAHFDNDEKAAAEAEAEMDKFVVGDIREKHSWKELGETLASTFLLTGVTGGASVYYTNQVGNQMLNEPNGKEKVKQYTDIVIKYDPDNAKDAKYVKDTIDSGGTPTGTQVYQVSAQAAEVLQEMGKREQASNQVKRRRMREENLQVEPVVMTARGPQFNEVTGQAYQASYDKTLGIIRGIRKHGIDEGLSTETLTSKETMRTAANAVAAYETGTMTAEQVNDLTIDKPEIRTIFELATGEDLSQYNVTKKGKIDAVASNNALMNGLLAKSADNYVQMARAEQKQWNNRTRGRVHEAVTKDFGKESKLAMHNVLKTVDPRDQQKYMTTARLAQNVYDYARRTDISWDKMKNAYKGSFRNINIDAMKDVYDAAKKDKAEAETPYLGRTVTIGGPMRFEKSDNGVAMISGEFTNDSARELTGEEDETMRAVADRLGVNIRIVPDTELAITNETGEQKLSAGGDVLHFNGSYDASTNTILLAETNGWNDNINYAMSHETTHLIAKYAPEAYMKLSNYVMDKWYKNNPVAYQAEIKAKQDLYKRVAGQELSEEGALEEIIADATRDFWSDPDFVDEITRDEEPGFIKSIVDAIKDMLRHIRNLLSSGHFDGTPHEDLLWDMLGTYSKAEQLWVNAYREAAKNRANMAIDEFQEKANTANTINRSIADDGLAVRDGKARWTNERIDRLISENGASNPDYSKAYAALMSPRDFLRLTLEDSTLRKWRESAENRSEEFEGMSYKESKQAVWDQMDETGDFLDDQNFPLDTDELREQIQTPYLRIKSKDSNQISGHEGRHRMRALMEAGVESVPVVIVDEDTKYGKQSTAEMTLGSENFVNVGNGIVTVTDLVPIKESNRDELIQKFGGEAQVRFSISEPVERVRDLIAVHNIRPFELKKAFGLGGFPMPSIAVTKDSMGHDMYGDISLLFHSDTIDPKKNRNNRVYGGDAYTPEFPTIENKYSRTVANNIEARLEELLGMSLSDARAMGIPQVPAFDDGNLDNKLQYRDPVEAYYDNEALRVAYLNDTGRNVEFPMTPGMRLGKEPELYKAVADVLPEDLDYDFWDWDVEGMRYDIVKAMQDYTRSTFPENLDYRRKKMRLQMMAEFYDRHAQDIIAYALEYRDHGGFPERLDALALTGITNQVNFEREAYEKWLGDLFDGIIEKQGIRNSKDTFTPNYNRRSWESLHDPVTLDNIVKAMKGALPQGYGGIRGAAQKSYKSLDEIRADEDRLEIMPEEYYEAYVNESLHDFNMAVDDIFDTHDMPGGNWDFEKELVAILNETRDKKRIQQKISDIYEMSVSDEQMNALMDSLMEMASIPTGYFEAKPRRAVGFDEVRAAVIPTNTESDIKDALTERGIDTYEYELGDEEDRKRAVNEAATTQDIKFSISAEAKEALEEGGIGLTESGTAVRLSVSSWEDTNQKELLDRLVAAGFDKVAAKKWLRQVNSIASIIYSDMDRLNYEADQFQDALKANSEYFYTLDMSTLCQKRRLYQGTYNAIMHRLVNRSLYPEDTVRLREMMEEMGLETPCGICYEESRKKNEGKFADTWLNGQTDKEWNQKLKEYDNKLKKYRKKLAEYEALEDKGKKKPPKEPQKPERWMGYANMEHTDPYIPTLADVTTTDGRARLREEHPEALEAYLEYQKGRGSANPKVSFTHTDYRGDILRMTATDIENVKHIGGLRIQSFSDFETIHVIDMMQAIMDMATMKLTSQAYTKVPAFADIFGGTGVKINLSLIQKMDENGKPVYDKKGRLVFDSKEGIDPKEAFRIRKKYSKNVGTILVGVNRQQILDAWADDRVDMVIPFHRSGWSLEEFERLGLKGYEDFQEFQSEKYYDSKKKEWVSLSEAKKKGIYSADYWQKELSGKENAELYLKKCAEMHYRPVFYNFLHDNGDGTWSLPTMEVDGYTADGYWKSLIDYKMYDNDGVFAPQEEVQPIFDMRAAKKVMNAYEGDPDTLPVNNDVVDAYIEDYAKRHPDAKIEPNAQDIKYSIPPIDIRDAMPSENNVDDYVSQTVEDINDIPLKDAVLEQNRQEHSEWYENFIREVISHFDEGSLTFGMYLDEKSVKKHLIALMGRVMNESGTGKKYRSETLQSTINSAKVMFFNMKEHQVDRAAETAWRAAKRIVDDIDYNDELYVQYKGVRDYLDKRKIQIPEGLEYDNDFIDFVRDNEGRLRFSSKGPSVNAVYKYLSKKYPQLFPVDMEDPIDMLLQIDYALDYTTPYREAYTSQEYSDLVSAIAGDLMDIVSEGEAYRTVADKLTNEYEERIRKMKARHEEAIRKVKETEKQKQDNVRSVWSRIAKKWKDKYNERIQKEKLERKEKKEKQEHKKKFERIEDKYNKLCKWVLDPTKEKNVPEELRKPLAEFLQTLDLQTENSKKLEAKTGHVANKTLRLRELKDRLNALAAHKGKDGEYVSGFEVDAKIAFLLEKLSDKLDENGNSIDALNNDDIASIDEFMKLLIRNIERYKKVKTETKMADLSDVGGRGVEFLKAKVDRDGEYSKRKGLPGAVSTINTTALTPAYAFDRLGPIKEMYDAVRYTGFDTYIRNEKMIIDRLDGILGQFKKKNKKGQTMPGSEIEKWRDDRSAQTIKLANGKEITMSAAQMMSLYCLAKRGEQALGHMMVGGIVINPIQTGSKIQAGLEKTGIKKKSSSTQKHVLTYEDVQNIISNLTTEQKDVADKLQELMSVDMAKLGNEAHRELYGYDMFEEDYYFPIKVHGNERSTDINTIGEVVEKIKSFGFTKPLTPRAGQAIEIDDIFSIVADHCNGMNLYNAYLVPITDFMKVFNYTHTFENGDVLTMKEAITQAYGEDMLKYILNLLKDINGIKAESRGGLEGLMNKAIGTAKRTAVFGNIRVALQQPTAIVRASAEINPKYLKGVSIPSSASAYLPIARITTKAMEEMWKYCPIAQWKAWGYYDTYMGKDIEDVMMNNWSIADDLLSGYYGQLDNATWAIIWQAVKAEQADKYPDMDHNSEEFLQICGRRASEVFDKTQVVDSTFHRSDAMRNKQIAVKLFTAFMAEPTLTMNVFRAGLYNHSELKKSGDKAGANKALARAITVVAAQAILVAAAQAVADSWRGKDPGLPWGDDDEEKVGYWLRWTHNFVYNFFDQLHLENNMYLIKDITPYVNYVISLGFDYYVGSDNKAVNVGRALMGWDQDYLYNQNNLVFAGLENIADGMKQAFKKKEKGEDYINYKTKEEIRWYDINQKVASGIGTFTGIPFGTLMRDFKPVWDLIVPKVFAADMALMDQVANKMGYQRIGTKGEDKGNESGDGYSMTADDIPGNLTDEQKQDILKAGEKRSKKNEGKENTEQLDYDTMLYNAMKAAAGLEGEEYNKAIYSSVAHGLKGYVADGDYTSIGMMRTVIEQAGGDVEYFDSRVMAETKTAYKKTLSFVDIDSDAVGYVEHRNTQKAMWRYMVKNGMTEEQISDDLVYSSDLARDLKVAYRVGDQDMIYESASALLDVGLTRSDMERLYTNRNKMDLEKYKSTGRYKDRLKSTGTFIWPTTGDVTSEFGLRDAPTAGASTNHPSIDIGAPLGSSVVAADGGIIIYTGWNSGYGNSVGIKHDNGMVTYYNHLYDWNVNVGDTVAQGQQIGQVGSTGISTGPHLDFKILDTDGNPVNPRNYLGY